MDVATVLSAMQAGISAGFTSRGMPLGDIAIGGGRITNATVAHMGAFSPAILLSCLRVSNLDLSGRDARAFDMGMGAYCIAAGNATDSGDIEVVRMVDYLMAGNQGILPGQSWGLSECKAIEPGTIDARNLFAGSVSGMGISLWAVTWLQHVFSTQ